MTEVEIHVGNRIIRSNKGINISMRGVHATPDDALPEEGASCRVSIILHERVTIEAGGKITRSAPGDLAVEFTDLDPDSYHHLRQLILNNTDEPEKAEQEFISHWGIRDPRF